MPATLQPINCNTNLLVSGRQIKNWPKLDGTLRPAAAKQCSLQTASAHRLSPPTAGRSFDSFGPSSMGSSRWYEREDAWRERIDESSSHLRIFVVSLRSSATQHPCEWFEDKPCPPCWRTWVPKFDVAAKRHGYEINPPCSTKTSPHTGAHFAQTARLDN